MRTIYRKRKYQAILMMLLLLVSILTGSIQVKASSGNIINSIDMEIVLDDQGNAQITEVWDADVSEGTEVYIIKDNFDKMELSSDIAVSDEEGNVYENIGSWNVNASFDHKAYKCGIHKNGTAREICFGISSYGHHVYTIQYSLSNFVSAYKDNIDGFNQKLINDQLSAPPRHVKVTIRQQEKDFTADDTRIWAFGFDGTIYLIDGAIVAETSEDIFTGNNYVTIMASFEKGIFTEPCESSKKFEDVKSTAFEGSDYENNEDEGSGEVKAPSTGVKEYSKLEVTKSIGGLVLILLTRLIPFIALFIILTRTKRMFRRNSYGAMEYDDTVRVDDKTLNYDRNIPFHGDLYATRGALEKTLWHVNREDMIGAVLLKFLKDGLIAVDEIPVSGFLGIGEKMQVSIRFLTDQHPVNPVDAELYFMLVQAAGSDCILQEKEFYKWSKKHYTKLSAWFGGVSLQSEKSFESFGGLIEQEVPSPSLLGLGKRKKKVVSPRGNDQIIHMLGFKKYLKDFTLIGERNPEEVALWDDYLIFATLFGIAGQVAKSFEDIYPSFFEGSSSFQSYSSFCSSKHMIDTMCHVAVTGYEKGYAAASSYSGSSSSGGGGSSSSGGGGGSTGGSSGGGFR